jgi:hypothetical protein
MNDIIYVSIFACTQERKHSHPNFLWPLPGVMKCFASWR